MKGLFPAERELKISRMGDESMANRRRQASAEVKKNRPPEEGGNTRVCLLPATIGVYILNVALSQASAKNPVNIFRMKSYVFLTVVFLINGVILAPVEA